jgi:hypothetical protein
MRINLNDKNKQFDRMFKIMESLENQTLLTENTKHSELEFKFFNRLESSIFDDSEYTTGKKPIYIKAYATDELSDSISTSALYKDFRNYWIIKYDLTLFLIEVDPSRNVNTEEEKSKRKNDQKEGNGEIMRVWEIQNK